MATRGRIKGWKPAHIVEKMTPAQREAYEAMIAAERAKRELEKAESAKAREAKKEAEKATRKALKASKDGEDKDWFKENDSLSDVQETVIHHVSREGFCIVETNELYWKNKINRWMAKYPDKVIKIERKYESDMIAVKIPYKFMKKVNVTTPRSVTEEQKERMSMLGKARKAQDDIDDIEDNVDINIDDEDDIEDDVEDDINIDDETIKDEVLDKEETDEEFESTPMNKYRDYEDKEEVEEAKEVDSEEESEETLASTVPQHMKFFSVSPYKGCEVKIDIDKIKETLKRRESEE